MQTQMDNIAINYYSRLTQVLIEQGFDKMMQPLNDHFTLYFQVETKIDVICRITLTDESKVYENDKYEIIASGCINEVDGIMGYLTKDNIQGQGKRLLTKASLYSAGKMFLPPQILPFVELSDVAQSKDKGRAWFRAIPSIGVCFIPGIGIPMAIGLGIGASLTADKVYTSVINPTKKLSKKQREQYQQLNLDKFIPKDDFRLKINEQMETYSMLCKALKQRLQDTDMVTLKMIVMVEKIWYTMETILYELYFKIFLTWNLQSLVADEFFVRVAIIEGLIIEYHEDIHEFYLKLVKCFKLLGEEDTTEDKCVAEMVAKMEPVIEQLGQFICNDLTESITKALDHMTKNCMEMKALLDK